MKYKTSLLVLLLTITAANAADYEMSPTDTMILNDVVGAIANTDEAKIFAKKVNFDKVTASFSADRLNSIINAEGMHVVGGDMACGFLKLKIEREMKRVPIGFGHAPVYKATLDKSGLIDASYCKLSE